MRIFHSAADKGRVLLAAGLVCGAAFPGAAHWLRPWLPEMIAGLLFLAAMRIGPKAALGVSADVRPVLTAVIGFQCLAPVCAAALAWAFGWLDAPLAAAVILMLSAPSVAAAPNLTILTGHDPAPALRLLIAGTALLPLTVLPSLALLPGLGAAQDIAGAALRLLAVIALAGGAGFAVRALFMKAPSADALKTLDGLSALSLAVVVVPLMSAVGPALRNDPAELMFWLAAACAANFGCQILFFMFARRINLGAAAVPFSVIAGNRNIALFFAALPPEATAPLMMFIGCYQAPMYLTPLIMARLYRRAAAAPPPPG